MKRILHRGFKLMEPMTLPRQVLVATDQAILKSFQNVVRELMTALVKSYNENRYEIYGLGSDKKASIWWKTKKVLMPTCKYDVEKTNSLVSPYVGIIEVDICLTTSAPEYMSYKLMEMATNLTTESTTTYTLKFAYQEGNWIFKRCKDFRVLADGTPWVDLMGGKWYNPPMSAYDYLKCWDPLH